MNIGKCKRRPKYICDKCGQAIPYVYQKGFAVNKFYIQKKYNYSIKKDFDLCNKCEIKLREWLKEKEVFATKEIIENFPRWEDKQYEKIHSYKKSM